MKSKMMLDQIFKKKKNSRLKNRRGASEIISTMMLMGITIVGAVILTYFVNDAFINGNLASASSLNSSSENIFLLAYDTRDSYSLLTLLNVDNDSTGFLCRVTCNVAPANSIPENGGTEFIVLQIQNSGFDTIFLEDITINNVIHTWDASTSGITLDASDDYLVGTNREYPADGMFSILLVGRNPIIQNENIQIQSGQMVNLLIKLDSMEPDIQLNKGLRILLDTGGIHPTEFFIETGDAR
jgi:flagellin-like protein